MNYCGIFALVLVALISQVCYNQFQAGVAETEWVGPNGFGFHSTAEDVSKGADLTGKVVLITGANSEKGLGFESARVLALRGAHVLASARTKAKAEEAIEKIKKLLPSGREYKFTPIACELGSLASVDQAVNDVKALNLPLHYLIANAGIMALPTREASTDGYEKQVAVNHLGHFHLITQLMDKMVESKPARVVMVSSLAHEYATSPRAFLESDNLEMPYDAWATYGNSKLSNIIFAKELNERYKSKGVLAYALHPGVIDTNLGRNMNPSVMKVFIPTIFRMAPTFSRTVPEGTATQVYAAVSAPDSEAGQYLSNCNVELFGSRYDQKDAGLLENAAVRAKFWATSEKMVKQALAKAK